MNEVFETLCNVFEELRCESGEREYSVQTDEALDANRALEKQNEIFRKYLSLLSEDDRSLVEDYIEAMEHAHFHEEQRAYYQGMVDALQILIGLGIVKESSKINEVLSKISR